MNTIETDKYPNDATAAPEEISLWEQVKRSRDIFRVDDYRDNHPYSVFKSEIDKLYYELRDEMLHDMKSNPTVYSYGYVHKLVTAGI